MCQIELLERFPGTICRDFLGTPRTSLTITTNSAHQIACLGGSQPSGSLAFFVVVEWLGFPTS